MTPWTLAITNLQSVAIPDTGVKCAHCGMPIDLEQERSGKNRFCGKECAKNFNNEQQKAARREKVRFSGQHKPEDHCCTPHKNKRIKAQYFKEIFK